MARFNLDDYVDTQTRVNEFWDKCREGGLNGFISTELLTPAESSDMFVMVRASVGFYEDGIGIVKSTGIASEVRSYPTEKDAPTFSYVNQTSWVENCETSAIGRAFANWGYATSGADRPSREEMAKVQRYEDAAEAGGTPAAIPPARQTQPRPAQGGGGYRQPAQRSQQGGTPQIANPGLPMSDKQRDTIINMAKGNHESIAMAMFEKEFAYLTKGEASDIIGELMAAQKRPAKPVEEVIIEDDHTF